MSNYDDIKAECCEANLLLQEYKLIDLSFGNVSVDEPERRIFAIKPSDEDYTAMKVDDMVVHGNPSSGHNTRRLFLELLP
jgi:L-ribulose-5-phosphate 4-epimerase